MMLLFNTASNHKWSLILVGLWIGGCVGSGTAPTSQVNMTGQRTASLCRTPPLKTLLAFKKRLVAQPGQTPLSRVLMKANEDSGLSPTSGECISFTHIKSSLDGALKEKCKAASPTCSSELTSEALLIGATTADCLSETTKKSLTPEAAVILGEKVSDRKGFNSGAFYQGSDGVKRYVKFYGDEVQVFSEHFANQVYRDLGLLTPNTTVFLHNSRYVYASETLGDIKSLGFELPFMWNQKSYARDFLKGFVADVLLANREIIGGSGNTVIGPDRKIYRLDSGSALLMRSSFGRKGPYELFDIREWDGFQNERINRTYERAFYRASLSKSEFCAMVSSQYEDITRLVQRTDGWQNYLDTVVPMFRQHSPEDFALTVNMLERRQGAINTKIQDLGCR